MGRSDSLGDYFNNLENDADKFAVLKQLEEFFNNQWDIIYEPIHKKILEHYKQRRILKHYEKPGAEYLTPKERDRLDHEERESIKELKRRYDQMVKEIIDYYDTKRLD